MVMVKVGLGLRLGVSMAILLMGECVIRCWVTAILHVEYGGNPTPELYLRVCLMVTIILRHRRP